MKVIAFYLPQFHQIKENDKWWGDGFTEWTNVKKAKSLFEKHNQPRIPINKNYYNLLDIKTQEWQSHLMKQYNIYGLCYYHYWFNGKKLLEKPLENLIKNKHIDTKFCMSWANEPWTRSWDGKNKDILISQEYGNKKEWKKHFDYLLQFFLDDRYIKIDNKPIFVIYRTNNIPNCEKMITYWKKLAKENGLKGLYLVETLNSFQNKPCINSSEAVIEFEPMYTLKYDMPIIKQAKRLYNKKTNSLDKFEYEVVYNRILNRKTKYLGKEKFSGAFVDWDNTPRKGNKGTVCLGANPDTFEKNMDRLMNKCKQERNDRFIFINAWNEWAEGTYLEPDSKYEYGYLEVIKKLNQKYL
ncbi:glycoside hydrolase family 99-like domain-containing protein [Romboutsia timonensis]|uniref:glycosyltransferase WbsX family protein n=1 Tax=Romboutsia timonensis TaxID=1776391 RepID=UPI002A7F703C|nr:glycoside hydrolase family 99-like domain-containing protein [Romboutsia timonensis]MDY3959846.1 glycoside hydrolase family 99-like domain-containing protein [Romboutsia timonensis]